MIDISPLQGEVRDGIHLSSSDGKEKEEAHSFASSTEQTSVCSSQDFEAEKVVSSTSFTALRIKYLLVTLAVMLADGLQGTHLYVLYESYGFSVASLYSLGFVTGAITTPGTGPLIDKYGRKASALLYCILEIGINILEQYPFLAGLIVSRMVGGVTTNLLSSVFETWLDTEYRKQGLDENKYEIIMRDSVIVSNTAAIASGYLAHILAESMGPVGPFQGAVTCTAVALVVVMLLWSENYGAVGSESNEKSIRSYVNEAWTAFRTDSRVLRVGIIQGLTVGSLQIFVFLWSPTLQIFSNSALQTFSTFGLDSSGEPAYGLIFGAFMAAGVAGGFCSPYLRQVSARLLSPLTRNKLETVTIEGEGEVRPMAVEFLAASCYTLSAILLFVPCIMDQASPTSFGISLAAFTAYEFLVGVIMPTEGVIRSLYLPSDARATMMTLPRMIVNLAVAVGVILTRSITTQSAFGAVSLLMAIAACLQMSLISRQEWLSFQKRAMRPARSLSITALSCASGALKRSSSMGTLSTSTSDLAGILSACQEWCEGKKEKLKDI